MLPRRQALAAFFLRLHSLYMIDHIGFTVSNIQTSKAFYLAALAPIGYELIMEGEGFAGLGANGKPDLWIQQGTAGAPLHLAFHTRSRQLVDAFHAAAIAAGGKDNGGPGVRAHYHPSYYGAFVHDPDGNNLEVVCHDPPAQAAA